MKRMINTTAAMLAEKAADFVEIADNGDVTFGAGVEADGDLGPLENIVDSNGHKRFFQGDIATNAYTGITYTYAKWALSGAHLIVVLAGSIDNGTLLGSKHLGLIPTADIPNWVLDKIIPADDVERLVEGKNATLWLASTTASTDIMYTGLTKWPEGIYIDTWTSNAFTDDTYFRICFDLLIDLN